MAKKKNSYFLEFISIVFAVTLALVLDEWRQTVKDDALNERVISSIKAEVTSNLALINESIPYHNQLIRELRNGEHVVVAIPLAAIPVDVDNDRQLSKYVGNMLLASQELAPERLEIRRIEDVRILVLDENVWRMDVGKDTLKLFGTGNIQLRSAAISNNAWQLSQATQVMVNLPFELIEALSKLHSRQSSYNVIAGQAIEKVYEGNPNIIGVLEDLRYLEQQLKADYEQLLPMLEAAID